ncbi:type I glyceraldehyde-3-phosphate dehydrogenase [bacterium]|nr:type I glyceraldehyde-3-phosphate dehydrogenase [bacterium]
MIRVAINGFGRIGRAFVRAAHETGADVDIVAINDLGDAENLAYLLKYDSVYGKAQFPISVANGKLMMGKWEAQVVAEKDPAALPWGTMNVDVVVECTGLFTDYAKAKAHLTAGAKKVVISAPAKGNPVEAGVSGATVLMGLNEEKLGACQITSNASCTTNASSPVIVILDEAIGIEKAILNTTHSYTATQALIDGPSKKGPREGRAAALNMIPSSTGAAIAVTQAYETLAGKFDGISIRVPTPAGSIADITFIAKRPTTVEEVNAALRAAAKSERWSGVFAVSEEELVSSDIVGDSHGSIADLTMTRVVDGNLVKVLAWYDNEMGYTHTLLRHVLKAGATV